MLCNCSSNNVLKVNTLFTNGAWVLDSPKMRIEVVNGAIPFANGQFYSFWILKPEQSILNKLISQ